MKSLKKRENITSVGLFLWKKKRRTAGCQEELPTYTSHTHTTNVSCCADRLTQVRICRFYFCLCRFFSDFNGGKNVLFKGCSCILSSSKLIGLENVLAHRPGLIGIKHKHMEWRRSHCRINRRYKCLASVITLGKGVCFCKCVCRFPGSCVHTGGDQPFPNKVRGNL